MLFLAIGAIAAVVVKVFVNDAPKFVDGLTLKKRALEKLASIPEGERNGVMLKGSPMYVTEHHEKLLRACPNNCGTVIRDVRMLGEAMAPIYYEKCPCCHELTIDGTNRKDKAA
jgi:hypothetical protein